MRTDHGGQRTGTSVLAASGPAGWSDSSARNVLQLMVEAVAEMIGFEVATLSVALDGSFVTVGYTGPEELREFVEQDDPVSVLDPVLTHEKLETWGRFRFLAAEHYDGGQESLDGHWVVLEQTPYDGPDAWRPDDVLLGLLHDGDRLVGMLSVDRPVDGRRPDARQRSLLERFAAQAERAVITALEREELVQQVAHAEAARRLIRSAAMPAQASVDAVLRHTHGPLLEGFAARGTWVQALDGSLGLARGRDGVEIDLPPQALDLVGRLARTLWDCQCVLVLADEVEPPEEVVACAGDLVDQARRAVAALGYETIRQVMAVPIGAGGECLGFLALARGAGDRPWSAVETASALEIGHDLGAALVTARALERERGLVSTLQQLDDHRTQLISTLSHELRTPLAVISGNLELLGDLDLGDAAVPFHQAMTRGTARMQKVVDDLLLLARVGDPGHPLQRVPVDLGQVAGDVVGLVASTAHAKGLSLHLDAVPVGHAVVRGDPAELDRLVGNLVSNAVKYTPSGGAVVVRLGLRGDEVVLQVVDDGLGISEEDRLGLFRAFFRSTNPTALREQGTGLGLTIVATVVERHGGRIDVDSVLGRGTTVSVFLPSAR